MKNRDLISRVKAVADFRSLTQQNIADATGVRAIKLVDLLRKKYGLPKEPSNQWHPDWNPKDYLQQKIKEIEEKRKQYAADFESAFSPLVSTDNKSEKP